jgi:hypothetical protein
MGVIALCAAAPPAITIASIRRLLRGARTEPSSDRWTVANASPLVAAVLVMVGAAGWARAEARRPVADPSFASAFAGCYELAFGGWIPSMMLGHSVHGIVPKRLQLDTMRGDPAHRATMYDTFERNELLIRPGWQGSAYWQPIDGERVYLHWNTGFHGVGVRLRRRGQELRGMAFGHTDVSGPWPEPRARVHARAIDCSSVESDTVRQQRAAGQAEKP